MRKQTLESHEKRAESGQEAVRAACYAACSPLGYAAIDRKDLGETPPHE
jgi:hypothetical protein